ncbi:MAG: hypothetical protein A3K19_01670 [Lentisphaerae bacterium RIFOXYB12_FULL_65_16]|nr:MAG: hypothetical protein A3K18_02795 [Lentisphaerae bacterium RIFOXYA12_64_32]OGV92859.1 MAG: hypothetical protein A3K19_01670 [Lentisphaerae bacterium RIFOXYB12_FULL_65_16]
MAPCLPGRELNVPLTTIDIRAEWMARMAVETVFRRLASKAWKAPRRFVARGRLIVRQSTGPASRGESPGR